MTSFETRFWLILGVVTVGTFSFVADDLNDLFHQRRTVEEPRRAKAAPTGPLDGYVADTARRPSSMVVADQSPVSRGRDVDEHSARGVSQSVVLERTLGRLDHRSPVEIGGQETAAKAGPAVDGDAGDVAPELARQDQPAPIQRQIPQSDLNTDRIHEVHASALARAPGENSVQTASDRSLQVEVCERLDAVKRNECVDRLSRLGSQPRSLQADSAETLVLHGEQAEPAEQADPAKKEVIAKAPSEPLDQEATEASHRALAGLDAPDDSSVGEGTSKSVDVAAAEQPSNLGGQQIDPAQKEGADALRNQQAEREKEVTAKASSEPLEQAPTEASHRALAGLDAADDNSVGEGTSKSLEVAAAEQPSNLGGQQIDPAQKESADALRNQQADPAQMELIARASSELLDQAPAEASHRALAGLDAADDSSVGEGTSNSLDVAAAEQASDLGGQQIDPAQKESADALRNQQADPAQMEVIARASSEPLDQALAEASHRVVAGLDAADDNSVGEGVSKSMDVAAAEQPSDLGGQQIDPAQKEGVDTLRNQQADREEVIAKASSEPLDQEPAETSHRVVAGLDSADDNSVGEGVSKSVDVAAAEQPSDLGGQQIDPAQKEGADTLRNQQADREEAIAKAPSEPLDQEPTETSQSGADRWVISQTTSPVDYSTVVRASIFLQSKPPPLKLSIYCRRGRTALELSGNTFDKAAAAGERNIVVIHSINSDPRIQQRWKARGSFAHYRGDAFTFLHSLPQQGELVVRVSDGKSVLHEGRLSLDGLNHFRERFASACKWRENPAASIASMDTDVSAASDRMDNRILEPALSDLFGPSRSKGVKAGQRAKVQREAHRDTVRLRHARNNHLRKPRPRLDEFLLFDEWD